MSLCSCSWDGNALGTKVWKGRTARTMPKRGNGCPNCGHPVEIGQPCTDVAGLHADDHAGFFARFHPECFELMERFADEVCSGDWCFPFDLEEASAYAMARGDEPFWREWLFLYEKTWAWTEVPHA